LKNEAELCSNKTNEILDFHVQFASLMAQQIDDASKSQYYYLEYNNDGQLVELAKKIRHAIHPLSINVERMTHELGSFVPVLEKEQVTVQKEQSVAKQITTIFATSFPSISGTDRHHPDPATRGSRLADTALGQAASELFKANSGAFLEHIILPLQRQK
jgi:hypothetical protein